MEVSLLNLILFHEVSKVHPTSHSATRRANFILRFKIFSRIFEFKSLKLISCVPQSMVLEENLLKVWSVYCSLLFRKSWFSHKSGSRKSGSEIIAIFVLICDRKFFATVSKMFLFLDLSFVS